MSEHPGHLHTPPHGGSASTAARGAKYQSTQNRRAYWLGFLLCVVAYLILSVQQPEGWGVGLWAALALLLVPALCGLIMGRIQAVGRSPRSAFLSALKCAGFAMFLYASITLTVLARRVGRPDGGEQVFLAGLLVTIVYSAVAGIVAGLVSSLISRRAGRREPHGTAP